MSKEEWRDVVGYEGLYQVSSLGRVRRVAGGPGAVVGRILKARKHNGYLRLVLCKGGSKSGYAVHRLVAIAFLGPPPSADHQVNHKNGIRDDNRPDNLEWVTPQENISHAIEVLGKTNKGEAHGQAKLSRRDVRKIRQLYATGEYLYRELGELFGASISTISLIIRREHWQHVGGPMPPKIHRFRGEANGRAKLTRHDVKQIRRLYAIGEHTQIELGEMFGTARTTICDIVHHRSWKHVS